MTVREGKAFSASARDRRFWIDVDWTKAPVGRSEATITIEGGTTTIRASLLAHRATAAQEVQARGAFGGLVGAFAVPAAAPARSVAAQGVRWEAIPDFGWATAAMSIFPVDAASTPDPAKAPRLEYAIFLPQPGRYRVDLITGPTLEVIRDRPLRVAVALDDSPCAVKAVFGGPDGASQDFLGAHHAKNTATNARTMTFEVEAQEAGRHVLKIAMVDPTLVLQTINISKGDAPASFFGPVLAGPYRVL